MSAETHRLNCEAIIALARCIEHDRAQIEQLTAERDAARAQLKQAHEVVRQVNSAMLKAHCYCDICQPENRWGHLQGCPVTAELERGRDA